MAFIGGTIVFRCGACPRGPEGVPGPRVSGRTRPFARPREGRHKMLILSFFKSSVFFIHQKFHPPMQEEYLPVFCVCSISPLLRRNGALYNCNNRPARGSFFRRVLRGVTPNPQSTSGYFNFSKSLVAHSRSLFRSDVGSHLNTISPVVVLGWQIAAAPSDVAGVRLRPLPGARIAIVVWVDRVFFSTPLFYTVYF